jgi:CheY-like chemotaxis protein
MDVEMPVKDGLSATMDIRERESEHRSARTPIIGLSGHTSDSRRQAALDSGMDAYVTKPYTPQAVMDIADQFCL